ncbi:MAG: MBL fold metallo-hydrolase [Alphaproteobacteria bacterium]|jgi:glyoxylase-like metal-dependent hydrolase (beta-lactamase superfamily II)|nr:MBL fold metallo-hydrolase [Alphaproteobacteria bacterium]
MTELPLGAAIIPVTPLQQNCSLLWCTKTMQAAVVDPGGDMDLILENIQAQNLKIEKILVTHAHVDHAGAVAALAEELDVPIVGPHKEDQFWIDQIEAAGQQYGMPDARAFTPSRWLDDGDSVTLGETKFDVYHCPGHTPGHVVFHHVDAGLAVVGDVLFQGSIGRSDFPRGDMATLVQSITGKLWPLGDDVTFIPGHGDLSTFGQERKTNPFVADYVLHQA